MSELVCVGTSDAFGSGGRRQSAYLLRTSTGAALVDCGGTTATGLEALGIERDEVDVILISHFHGDHFGGIPVFLLGALYEDARRKPLTIAGPPEIESRVRAAASALGYPLDARPWSFPLAFQELLPGERAEVGPVTARSFGTFHSPDSHPHGFVLEADGHRVAYSGDTGWFDELPARVRGSELFLCECTQVASAFEYHLSLEELSAHRSEFDCGRMVLTHLGPAMRARGHHAGFEVADDGLSFKF